MNTKGAAPNILNESCDDADASIPFAKWIEDLSAAARGTLAKERVRQLESVAVGESHGTNVEQSTLSQIVSP